MEKLENPTAIRVKNNFSIENILSRPENCESLQRPVRQNTFQNNHILFFENQVKKSEEKVPDNQIDNEDNETNSEAASDDGNSSVHSKCQSINEGGVSKIFLCRIRRKMESKKKSFRLKKNSD